MKIRIFTILVFTIISSFVIAQNNDCVDAIEPPSLDNFCDSYTMTGATFDLLNGGCVAPVNAPNVWFKFTAQGPEVTVSARNGGGRMTLTLVEFDPTECDYASAVSFGCAQDQLTINGLVEGNVYFILVTKDDQANMIDQFLFCIDNPAINAPPNDDPCDAIAITPDGSCRSGTTVDANQEFAGTFCMPGERYEQMVWYSTTISAGNNTLEVTMSGLTDGVLVIAQFPTGCNGANLNILGTDCDVPYSVEVPVNEGEEYYIGVSSDEVNEGTFDVCATESGPPPGCAETDDCADAALNTIPTPAVNGTSECITDCNVSATPDIFIPTCIEPQWTSTYYQITTDATTRRLSITLEDLFGTMDAVAIALLTDCNTFVECQRGAGGVVNLTNVTVTPNTTYRIVVATPAGGQSEDFELCVTAFNPPDDYCVGRSADTSNAHVRVIGTSLGSPYTGPFIPGEIVDFEFFIQDYSNTTSQQWLQAMIPVFGTGWAPSSFGPTGEPMNPNLPNGSWNWYAANENDYNGDAIYYSLYNDPLGRLAICYFTDPDCPNTGITAGSGLPAAWYAYRPGGGGCANNGDPDNGYGDGRTGSWTITFSLRVREFSGPEGCDETGYVDCSVKMFSMSDEQIGCWTGAVDPNACAGDEYKVFNGINKCCIGPELIPEDITICSGESTAIDLNSDLEESGEDIDYSWTVSAPPSVTGASDGFGQIIDQVLTNTSTSPQIVTYTVTPELANSFCPGTPGEINVTVLPEIVADAGPDIEGCAEGIFTIGGSPTASGGSGSGYTYEWNNGAGTDANPEIQVTATTRYVVTVTDENGCSATDEMIVRVSAAIFIEIEGDSVYCAENGFSELTATAESTESPFEYEWGGPFYSDQRTIEATEGLWTVTVTDKNGCTGTQEINVEERATPVIDFILNPDTDTVCEGDFVDIIAVVYSDGYEFDYQWDRPIGPGSTTEIEVIREEGYYVLNVIDEFGCMASDSVHMTVVPYPEVEILGELEICPGTSTTLRTNGDYKEYLWSNGSTADSIVVDEPGAYTVIVTNAGGCEDITTVDVVLDESSVADAGPDRVLTCDETSITLMGSGSTVGNDFDILWSTITGNIVSGETTFTPVIDDAGFYYLEITSNTSGCSAIDSVVVSYDTIPPVAEAGGLVTLTCGSPTIVLDGAGSATVNVEYQWSTTGGNIVSGATTLTPTIDAPGTYYIEVTSTDNECSAIDSVVVDIDESRPTAVAGEDFTIDCINETYTPETAGSSTGANFDYLWSSPTGGSIQSGATTLSPVIDSDGTFVLQVTNTDNGCVVHDTLIVEENKVNPDLSGENSYLINCYQEDTTIHVVVDNYNVSYTYDWTLPDGSIENDVDSTHFANSPGEYVITVTDNDNGCSTEYTISVMQDIAEPIADAGNDAIIDCSVSEIMLDGTNSDIGTNFSILWTTQDGNITTGEQSPRPTVNQAGTYTITVINTVNGCQSQDEVIVTISEDYPVVDAGESRTLTCDSTTLTLLGTAENGTNLTYLWTTVDGNIVSGASTLNPVVDEPGSYVLTVRNEDNGCEATSTVSITRDDDQPAIIAGYNQTLDCNNRELTIDATGSEVGQDISYDWSTVDGNVNSGQGTLVISINTSGTYVLTIENNRTGCVSTREFVVDEDFQSPAVDIQSPDTITCRQNEILLDGSASSSGVNFAYQWKTVDGSIVGDATQNTATVNLKGTYTLVVTNTVNGCKDSLDVFVAEDVDRPQIDDIDDVTINCYNETLDVTLSTIEDLSIMNILWSSSDGVVLTGDVTSDEVTVGSAGTVTVRLTNTVTECYVETSFSVIEDFEPPIARAGPEQILTCDKKTLTLNGQGSSSGGNITYEWSASNGGNVASGGTTLTPVVDAAGTYYILVTNQDNGCTAIDSVEIGIDENLPQISVVTPQKITCEREQVTIDASQSSSGKALRFEWSTTDGSIVSGETTLELVVDQPGTYELTIYDVENDCSASSQIQVEEDKVVPVLDYENPGLFTCSTEDLGISLVVTDAPDYEVSWTTQDGEILSGQGSEELVVGSAGSYRVTVRNTENGCISTTIVVVEPDLDAPVAFAGEDFTLNCYVAEREIDASGSSSGADYEISWTTDDGNIVSGGQTLSPLVDAGGTYKLTIRNITNDCVDEDVVIVGFDMDPIDVRLSQNGPLNCSREIVSINSDFSTSQSYELLWGGNVSGILGEVTSRNIRVDEGGIYTFEITNTENGCVTQESIEVINNIDTITDVVFEVSDPRCMGDETGCLVISDIAGGQAPYTITVDGNRQIGTTEFCGMSIGNHILLIEDANGCSISSTFEVQAAPEYSITIGNTVTIEEGDSTELVLSGNVPTEIISSVRWFIPELTECADCYKLTITPEKSFLVQVEVIDANGCVYKAIKYIAVKKPRRVYVPTAFTPNGDRLNDILTVYAGPEVKEISYFRIYDRWGELVYENLNFQPNDESIGWDGKYRSEAMNQDVFVYKLMVEYDDGEIEEMTGDVTLLQ